MARALTEIEYFKPLDKIKKATQHAYNIRVTR